MLRIILGIIAGILAWAVIAILLNLVLRHAIPGYTQAEPIFAFTLPMLLARLVIALIASLAAGALTQTIAPARPLAPWITGLLLLALFLPVHIHIGLRLPLWYHLLFLLTLAPLVGLGARLAPKSPLRPLPS